VTPRKRKLVELPDRPKLLVMETGPIGELMVITPALRAIGKAFPSADVTVMVRPDSALVLVGSPYVKKLLPVVSRERKGFLGVMQLASWVRTSTRCSCCTLPSGARSSH